jgi:hypothetical protein
MTLTMVRDLGNTRYSRYDDCAESGATGLTAGIQ